MKRQQANEFIKSLLEKGYVWNESKTKLHTPAEAFALGLKSAKGSSKKERKGTKTGWVDDYRNIRNKARYVDEFMSLASLHLQVDIWPEFFFSTDRDFRIDYAIPIFDDIPVKVALEQEGGIWMEKSGHNTGTGITRDMEKNNLLVLNGWTLIRRTPAQLQVVDCGETLALLENILRRLSVKEPINDKYRTIAR
ncbi:hypothetical protein [Pedobacter sp. SYSU D00535]|uniref:hypothetical protein n=1 Tax=Pedobacter sp. SYSU D00535 TaxID=2810308 RepID=UPI001A95DC5E|nr:hypothetical protein [Pedobacter sp. SYSU D00535]